MGVLLWVREVLYVRICMEETDVESEWMWLTFPESPMAMIAAFERAWFSLLLFHSASAF